MRRRHVMLPLAFVVAMAWLASCAREEVTEPKLPDVPAPSGDVADQDIIPGQYIVVFKDGVANPVRLAGELASAHGLTLRHTYQHAIKGFSAVMPEAAVAALQRNPNIESIEQNRYWYVDTHPRLSQQALLASAAVVKGKPPGGGGGDFAAPTNLAATASGTSTIDLAWTDNTTDETGFEIERRLGQGGTFTKIAELGANVTSYPDDGLNQNTEYCYRVRAFKPKNKSSNTFSEYSNIDCATTHGTPPAPPDGDPSNLSATAVDHQRIDLAWTDGSTNEDGFSIERCTGAGCTNFAEIATVGANVTTYMNTGLQELTTYRYQVRAFTGPVATRLYSGYADIAQATTDAAPPPPPGCNDNGVHDDTSDPGLWGIRKIKVEQNSRWKGVRGNEANPDCVMKAEFFGLDTGVDSDHPDLNVDEIRCFLAGTPGCTGEDGHGHGTHTAGTAAAIDGGPAGGVVGVAPGAKIHGYKVCTDGGSCPNDDIIAGIEAVTAYKTANGTPMVANMSLGGGISDPIDTAVRRSVNAGVTYTLSAGNGVFGACFFPANSQNASPARVGDDDINASNGSNGDTRRVNGAITTTSSNQNDTDVNCNFGNPVTVAAPGSGIKSTWLNGGYNTISGTSMAAPHSAGGAILVLQGNQGLTPTAVEQEIVDDLDPWTTNDLPNADGRLDARCLGTGSTNCAGAN